MVNKVELAAEIADLWLKDKCSAWATPDSLYREEPNGDIVYVDNAQNMFVVVETVRDDWIDQI